MSFFEKALQKLQKCNVLRRSTLQYSYENRRPQDLGFSQLGFFPTRSLWFLFCYVRGISTILLLKETLCISKLACIKKRRRVTTVEPKPSTAAFILEKYDHISNKTTTVHILTERVPQESNIYPRVPALAQYPVLFPIPEERTTIIGNVSHNGDGKCFSH